LVGGACAFIISFYFWKAAHAVSELGNLEPSGAYYNLLADGFRKGQLSVAIEAPPELSRLPDPYAPTANAVYRKHMFEEGRLHDMSFYKGRLFLYFSPIPALLLFWPYHALSGGYLFHSTAVAIFCSVALLIAAGLIHACWRRYFSHVHPAWLATVALALGMANSASAMFFRPDVWEVPISCALMLTMATLAALWQALHDPKRRNRWLMLASLAFALVIATRPVLLFGAFILVLPLVETWRDSATDAGVRRRRILCGLGGIAVPLMVVGILAALYNYLRFDNPLEFGQRFQLSNDRHNDAQYFSWRFLWFNFRMYFLSVPAWKASFPFIGDVPLPEKPLGHAGVENSYGILTNTPVALFVLILPLAWRQIAARSAPLALFLLATLLLFAANATLLCSFFGACMRYQVDFHPPLVVATCIAFLAAIAYLPLRGAWRTALVIAWCGALSYSAIFSYLKSFMYRDQLIESLLVTARAHLQQGKPSEAIGVCLRVLRVKPDLGSAHQMLALAEQNLGHSATAFQHYQEALRYSPDDPTLHSNLGLLCRQSGRLGEAIEHFETALRSDPHHLASLMNLGLALLDAHRPNDAVRTFETAVQVSPNFGDAYYQLALALKAVGRLDEARRRYNEGRRLQPAFPEINF
jgi:Flp pilus assembly protein TadD